MQDNSENLQSSQTQSQTYDVAGLIIGGIAGLVVSFFGIVNFLMGVILGMFIGLVAGTFIKKKE